jgi:hypothetical protein
VDEGRERRGCGGWKRDEGWLYDARQKRTSRLWTARLEASLPLPLFENRKEWSKSTIPSESNNLISHDRPIDVQFSSNFFPRRISTYDSPMTASHLISQIVRTFSAARIRRREFLPACCRATYKNCPSAQSSMFHGQTSFSSDRFMPASAKSPHSSPPSTPTVSLVSSLPNGQITRRCKRPSRSRRCSAPCNWSNKPYTTNSKPVGWIPMSFSA